MAKGNPSRRPVNDAEPLPRAGPVAAPDWLGEEARKVWDRVAPDLVDCGMLRPIDAAALGRYCELLVVWVQCKDYIAKHGRNYPVHALPTVAERKAGKKQGPLVGLKPMPDVSLLMRCSSELVKLERELGLTPSARTRIRVERENTAKSTDNMSERARRLLDGPPIPISAGA